MNFDKGLPKNMGGIGGGLEDGIADMLKAVLGEDTNPLEVAKEIKEDTRSIRRHPFGFPMFKVIQTTMRLVVMGTSSEADYAEMIHDALEWRITKSYQEIANRQEGIPKVEQSMDGVLSAYMLFLKHGITSFIDFSSAVDDSLIPEDIDMLILENQVDHVSFVIIPHLTLRMMTTGGEKNAEALATAYGFDLTDEYSFQLDETCGWGYRTNNLPLTSLNLLDDTNLMS